MFFDQIKEIDGNIKQLRTDLKNIAGAADDHFDQLDDIAAHIIALEAMITVVAQAVKIDPDLVQAKVKEMTADPVERPDGSVKAALVVKQLLENGIVTGH